MMNTAQNSIAEHLLPMIALEDQAVEGLAQLKGSVEKLSRQFLAEYRIRKHDDKIQFAQITHQGLKVYARELENALLCLAHDPRTSAGILQFMANSRSDRIAEAVAANGSASQATLASLANHKNANVRIAVAENPQSSFAVIACLIEDRNVDVRYAIAANPLISRTLIIDLLEDENPYVSCRAVKTLNILEADLKRNVK